MEDKLVRTTKLGPITKSVVGGKVFYITLKVAHGKEPRTDAAKHFLDVFSKLVCSGNDVGIISKEPMTEENGKLVLKIAISAVILRDNDGACVVDDIQSLALSVLNRYPNATISVVTTDAEVTGYRVE